MRPGNLHSDYVEGSFESCVGCQLSARTVLKTSDVSGYDWLFSIYISHGK